MTEKILSNASKKWSRFLIFRGNRGHLIFTVITILATLAILGFLVYREREVLAGYEWRLRLWPAMLSFVFFVFAMLLPAVLWGQILNALGSRLTYLKHIQNYCISNVAKRIPGTVWYVASRAQLYKEDGIDLKLTALASGIEMALITLSGTLVSAVFAFNIILDQRINPWSLVAAFLIGCIFIHPRVVQFVFRLLKVEATMFSYKDILLWLIWYLVLWVIGGIVLFLIGNAVTPIPIQNLGYVIGSWALVGVLSSLLFFSPSNLGITEIGLSLLLGQIMPVSVAVVIAIAARILIILFEIIWASIFLGHKALNQS